MGMSKVFGGMQHHRIAQVCCQFKPNFISFLKVEPLSNNLLLNRYLKR